MEQKGRLITWKFSLVTQNSKTSSMAIILLQIQKWYAGITTVHVPLEWTQRLMCWMPLLWRRTIGRNPTCHQKGSQHQLIWWEHQHWPWRMPTEQKRRRTSNDDSLILEYSSLVRLRHSSDFTKSMVPVAVSLEQHCWNQLHHPIQGGNLFHNLDFGVNKHIIHLASPGERLLSMNQILLGCAKEQWKPSVMFFYEAQRCSWTVWIQ